MICKRKINNLSYVDMQKAIWTSRTSDEKVSLTDVFTVDALFYMAEHPDWPSFPVHFKDLVRSTVDQIFKEYE